MNTFWQDLRYGARLLVKKPGFTALIVLTLGIGIGANTTIFSAAQAIFLRSLPYGEAERLLYLSSSFPGNTRGGDNFSYADFADLAQRNRLFEKVAAYQDWVAVALTGIDEPVRLTANFVSGSYFEMLGASAALGRTFTAEEQRVPATESVVILSHSCWQRQFGGDPNIIGRRISLNQTPATVIGVMREGFRDFEETWRPEVDAWLPMGMSQGLLGNQLAQRSFRVFYGVAKPRAGVTLEQARTEIEAISQQLAAENPATDRGYSFHLAPLRDHFVGNFYNPMRLLLIGSGFVLLIGCANVAGLLLARVAGRRREMAVRAAVGATRGRLIRQLLVESTLVSLLAGLAGILIAAWLAPLLRAWGAKQLPGFVEFRLDGFVLTGSILLSILTGFIFGLAPAWESAKTDLREALNQSSSRNSGRNLLRRTLVVAEVALSIVLLISAGLMLKSFQKLMSTGLGYPTKNLLTMRLDLRAEKYTAPEARNEFARNLVEKTESLPGVESTLLWGPSDLGRGSWVMFVAPEGRAVNRQEDLLMVSRHSVNPDGLRNLGIPLVGGREFTWHDSPQTQPVAIISESLAKNFWPQENPIGKRIQFQGRDGRLNPLTIVGLAADARHRPRYEANLGARAFRPQLDVYLPYPQRPNQALVVALRTNVEPSTVLPSFKQAVLSLDPNLPVYDVTTLDERLAAEEAPTRAIAGLMTAYAALALFLAALGIYGVLAQSVAERRQEIGIRIALGAQKTDIMRLIVGGGMTLAVLGLVLGVGSSFALTRLMTTLLFGVESHDPLTFSIAPLALALVALIACWIPARRATRVNPITALREY